MLLFFSFLLCLELGRLFFFRGGSTRGSHGDSVLGTGEFHRYIDGHKGRVAASMAWAGVGALDATFVPRKHAIAAIVICRRTEITYILLSRWPRPRRASP